MKCPKFECLKLGKTLAVGTVASVLLAVGASESARAGDFNLTLNGTPINEALETTDNYLVEDNSYFDSYSFTGRAGQRVTITMSSQQVDAYLILFDPSGNSLAQDDDGGGNLDARIEITLPVDGVYTVYANSYAGGVLGPYTLQASSSSAPSTSTSVLPPPTSTVSNPGSTSGSTSSTDEGRFYCDNSGRVPLTMARSNRTGDIFPIIQWTSEWAPAPYTPSERCQTVSARLSDLDNRFDRLILTVGTLNGQPVVCAASSRDAARQGVCAGDSLVVTTQYQEEAADLIRGLQNNFTRIVAGNSPDILPASSGVEGTTPYVDISGF